MTNKAERKVNTCPKCNTKLSPPTRRRKFYPSDVNVNPGRFGSTETVSAKGSIASQPVNDFHDDCTGRAAQTVFEAESVPGSVASDDSEAFSDTNH